MEKTNPSAPPYSPSRWLALAVLFLAVLVIICVRVRLRDFPLERDEGEYAYVGQLILEGIPPYQLACNMKLPGVYLAYAAVMSVLGQTTGGIHLGVLIVNLATLAVLFFVARRILDLYGAVIATTAYGLMILSPAYLGLAAHAEHFVVLAGLLGIWMLLRIEKKGSLPACFSAGFFFGVAFVTFQMGGFWGIWGGLYLVWTGIAGKIGARKVLARLGIFSLGCVTPFLVICLWLKMEGVFPQFWYWIFTYAREYSTAFTLDSALQDISVALTGIFDSTSLLYVAAGAGLICLGFSILALNTRVFLFGLFIFSCLAVCPGFYFREHYFIVLAPAIALLAGVYISCGSRWIAKTCDQPLWFHLTFLLGALACAQCLYADRDVLFYLSPHDACRVVYGLNPFPESLDIASYIEKNSRPDQRVFVLGDEPQIYFYSHRRSPNTQIYLSQLMDPRPYSHKMQERMISEIKQNSPEFVVYCSFYASLLQRPDSDPLLTDWVHDYEKQNMQLVGLIQTIDPQTTKMTWGPDAATTPLESQTYIVIYQRLAPARAN